MSSAGTWFVLCDPARAIPMSELAGRLAGLKHATVTDRGGSLVVTAHDALTGRDADIDVGLSTAPHVGLEAQEIAERNDRADIAVLGARYELSWDLRLSDEVYNTLAVVAEKLAAMCGGVIYDVNDGRLV